MRGQTVPLILIPRFTGLVGNQDFTTPPLEVTPYALAALTLWRGPLVAQVSTTPTYAAFLEVSHDADTWFTFPPGPAGASGFDPGGSTTVGGSLQMTVNFLYRWFRVRIELRGTSVGVTTYVTGTLEYRVE